MIQTELKHLKKWTRPDCYIGEQYPEFYVVLSQHRDSDILTQSNFQTIHDALKEVESKEGIPAGYEEAEGDCTVQVISASHWACGWIETLLIHESDTAAIEKAEELLQQIADYPVLDDEDFSRREYEYAREVWTSLLVSDRLEYIQRYNAQLSDYYNPISIFAARRDEMPRDEDGSLQEELIRP